MNVVLVDDAFLDGREERPGVLADAGAEVRDVDRALDCRRVEFALLRVVLAHRRDVRPVLQILAVEDGVARVRRRNHDVGVLYCGRARRHRRDRGVQVVVQVGRERLPALLRRRVHPHGVEVPDLGGRLQLAARLRPAADDGHRRGVLASEGVHADGARRARLEGIHASAVEDGQGLPGVGVEQRRDEPRVPAAEPRTVRVPAHRARLRENGGVAREHPRRVVLEQPRSGLGRRAFAALAVALADRVHVVRRLGEPGEVVVGEEQCPCHGPSFGRLQEKD